VLTDWPPEINPTFSVMPRFRSVSAWMATILCASSPMAAFLEVAAGMRGLPEDLNLHEDAALAAGDDVAGRPAGLRVEDGGGFSRHALDDRPRRRRRDLLVRRDQPRERCWCAAEALESLEHEGVHHETRLHVGDAGAVGASALDLEFAPGRLTLRKHRVAMPHQHDRPLV